MILSALIILSVDIGSLLVSSRHVDSIHDFPTAHHNPHVRGELLPKPRHTFSLGHRRSRHSRRRMQRLSGSLSATANLPEQTPVFTGYGTHYAYIYVGTPPQRQSVIIDTGSHYTAFPCVGCAGCGQHTDNYFDISKSSTSIPCTGNSCSLSQSYAEGSSWRAQKVTDKIWIGGENIGDVPIGDLYNISYQFGCQTSESGLFTSQLEDGIMGMSMSADSLQNQLLNTHRTTTNMFGLCFRVGGGVMTLGGIDESMHTDPSTLRFAQLKNAGGLSGWYGVTVINIQFRTKSSPEVESRLVDIAPASTVANAMNKGVGTIIDSGTTETYLPSTLFSAFKSAFHEITGVNYIPDTDISLTAAQLALMPDLVFTFQPASSSAANIEVTMPFHSYSEKDADKFSFQIYLDEPSSFVLGANFMDGHNIIFDQSGQRIGFAESTCHFESAARTVGPSAHPVTRSPSSTVQPSMNPTYFPTFTVEPSMVPSWSPTSKPTTAPTYCEPGVTDWVPVTACSATCTNEVHYEPYVKDGLQLWQNLCSKTSETEYRTCHEKCSVTNEIMASDSNFCSIEPWSVCSVECQRTRTASVYLNGYCVPQVQKEECQTGEECTAYSGDFNIEVHMRLLIPVPFWSIALADDFVRAFSSMFQLSTKSISIISLNHTANSIITDRIDEETSFNLDSAEEKGFALIVYIRLLQSDYPSEDFIVRLGQSIVSYIGDTNKFPIDLLGSLERASGHKLLDYSRYGWMSKGNLQVYYETGYVVVNGRHRDQAPVVPRDNRDTVLIAGAVTVVFLIIIFCFFVYHVYGGVGECFSYFCGSGYKTNTESTTARRVVSKSTRYTKVNMSEVELNDLNNDSNIGVDLADTSLDIDDEGR